jgi:hypothetical protein
VRKSEGSQKTKGGSAMKKFKEVALKVVNFCSAVQIIAGIIIVLTTNTINPEAPLNNVVLGLVILVIGLLGKIMVLSEEKKEK